MKNSIKDQFAEKGFYLAKGVYNPAEIGEMEQAFDQIVKQLQASGEDIDATWQGHANDKIRSSQDQIFHTHNVHQYSHIWLKAMLHEGFLEISRQILGEDIVLHHNKLFQKPAEKGSPFPMHQDWSYFPTEKDSMIAAIIHVSDATDEMGCLRVYEGSHLLGRQSGTSGQGELPITLLETYPIETATAIEASAGDVLFFHYFTLHGSMPNRSPKTRKTVLMQLYSGKDRMEEGVNHPNEGLVLSGWNEASTRKSAGNIK